MEEVGRGNETRKGDAAPLDLREGRHEQGLRVIIKMCLKAVSE